MANISTKSITIYQKTYQLPILEDTSFQKIQSQIKQRQQIIKNQKRVIVKQKQVQKKSFFGLRSNTEIIEEKITHLLSFEDKFNELERLVNDYDQLISFITKHKQLYLQFFDQLTNDLKQIVREKLAEAKQQEDKRLSLLKNEIDPDLITILEGQKEQILGNIWLFGKAFLLMLKKIKLISEGIEKITTDQDVQKNLLIDMVGKLGKYKKVNELQKEITQSGKEAEKLAENAINFEQYLQPFICSFQGLIEQVCQQDNSLNGTVNEIQSLVEDIISSNTGSFIASRADDLSKNMLDFLITNEQKKERLVMALEDAQRQGIDWTWQQINLKDCDDLTQVISALQAHIHNKLEEYSKNDTDSATPSQILVNEKRGIELKSVKNIDYKPLESLLSEEKWREADEKTADLMLQVIGKGSWVNVYSDDLLNFPKTDLQTIDQLWLNYSDGKFGFSPQKQIWLDCGGKIGEYHKDIYYKFADKVGWRKGENWLFNNEIKYTSDSFQGHLPVKWLCGKGGWTGFSLVWEDRVCLFSIVFIRFKDTNIIKPIQLPLK